MGEDHLEVELYCKGARRTMAVVARWGVKLWRMEEELQEAGGWLKVEGSATG